MPSEVMYVVSVRERIAMGYGEEHHFKRNEEILMRATDGDIRNMR